MIGGNYQSPWRIKPREARLPAHLRAKVIAKEASRDDAEAAGLGWAGLGPRAATVKECVCFSARSSAVITPSRLH